MKDREIIGKVAECALSRYEQGPAEWNYVNGLGLECIFRIGKNFDNEEWMDRVRACFDVFITPEGTVRTYDLHEYSMDQIRPGNAVFDLYHRYGDERYRKVLDLFFHQLMTQPRTPSGGFWHKKIYPNQMWLDGLYMEAPFYVRYAGEFGNLTSALKDIVLQFSLVYEHTHDPVTGLLYHAWDESGVMEWCNPVTGCSPSFWSRALGWFCMALVDVIDYIPRENQYEPYRNSLIAMADSLVEPILKVQEPESGLWYQVLDQGNRKGNYLESSGSSMFSYFLLKMYRNGYLSETIAESARQAGLKAFHGLVSSKIVVDDRGNYHVADICRGAGLGSYGPDCPYRDGTFAYYAEREPKVWDNLQGVGPFLLAGIEAGEAQQTNA